jgi:hypothetical protein
MSRTTSVLVLIALCLLLVAPNAGAYPRYHPADTTNDITAFGVCEGTTDACQIDADCAGVSCGLRVSAGDRYQKYRDPTSVTGAGVVAPFDLSTDQHTVIIGITLNNELLR